MTTAEEKIGPSPFDVPGVSWTPVSPRLPVLRRTLLLLEGVPAVLVLALFLVLLGEWMAWVTLAVGLGLLAWAWVAIGRAARTWGYTERADDLLVRHGLLVRRLVVVPYGRMQFVDVTSGPMERRFGLASVKLHTAAATTNASIPGLAPEEAARLRDRLAARGEAQAAGL